MSAHHHRRHQVVLNIGCCSNGDKRSKQLQKEVEELRNENLKLKSRLSETKVETQELKMHQVTLQDEIKKAERTITDLDSKYQELKDEIRSMKLQKENCPKKLVSYRQDRIPGSYSRPGPPMKEMNTNLPKKPDRHCHLSRRAAPLPPSFDGAAGGTSKASPLQSYHYYESVYE